MIRLLPDPASPALGIEEAKESASSVYAKARAAQRKLVSDLSLIDLLYRPGGVSIGRLRGELREARNQAERAQAVVDALAECVELIETTAARHS